MKSRTAIYPGTFDPITNGHLDIIKRAARLFDSVIIAVSNNIQKKPLFDIDERTELVRIAVQDIDNVAIDSFDDLLVNYVSAKKADAVIRGLRVISDFEYEFQMALMNRKLLPDIETVYLMPSEEHIYISSSIVKEVGRYGGNISCFLPPEIETALRNKLRMVKKIW
ncbi:pantetheine-phosphate adenylyltransferase [bacterium]|nr:pantetheine-phosphate adenylyltransferase [bacterium]